MVGNHQTIYELGTNRRMREREKRKDSERNRKKISKVVKEEWREEQEKNNSLGIYI